MNDMNDEVRAARNKRRACKRQTDLLMIESELLLAQHLNTLLKEKPGELTAQQAELLPVLVTMLEKLQDRRLAAAWSSKLAVAISGNPRILDGAPGSKSLHKVASLAAKTAKAGAPDRRLQVEKRREQGEQAIKRAMASNPGKNPPPPGLSDADRAEWAKRKGPGDLLDGI